MRRFGGRFRARRFRGRRRLPVLRARKHITNVLVPVTSIASATTTGYTLAQTPATIDEDVDHTIISNGSTIGEIEPGARVRAYLEIELGAADPVNATYAVSLMFWKDSTYGAITSPTNATQIIAPGTTLELAALKKNTCQFERFLLTVEGDKRHFRLRIPRRLSFLRQGEAYKIHITNHAPDTDSISFTIWGKFVWIA